MGVHWSEMKYPFKKVAIDLTPDANTEQMSTRTHWRKGQVYSIWLPCCTCTHRFLPIVSYANMLGILELIRILSLKITRTTVYWPKKVWGLWGLKENNKGTGKIFIYEYVDTWLWIQPASDINKLEQKIQAKEYMYMSGCIYLFLCVRLLGAVP
jgi:hypothetical protein